MIDPDDTRELIEEAIERTEAAEKQANEQERFAEKRFRDRVSILVSIFAVVLAMLHMAAGENARDGILHTIEASDTYNYMQAKIIRETMLKSIAADPAIPGPTRASQLKEAHRLRFPDAAGHGIVQLQAEAERQRKQGDDAAKRGERYELGETLLQMGIVLLSVALIARSAWVVAVASTLGACGALLGLVTKLQLF